MVASIKDSKLYHRRGVKQEHLLKGIVQLWVEDELVYQRRFRFPKDRIRLINEWYKSNPSIKTKYHYFIVKYDYT